MADEGLNHKVYGPEATPRSILEGKGAAHLLPQVQRYVLLYLSWRVQIAGHSHHLPVYKR